MPYGFDEAVKVLKFGYSVRRPAWQEGVKLSVLADELRFEWPEKNMDCEGVLDWADILAEDWETVDPPHIVGELHMVMDSAVMS